MILCRTTAMLSSFLAIARRPLPRKLSLIMTTRTFQIYKRTLVINAFLHARWRWRHLHGEALERYQERRARRVVAYTLQHSPFYRTHWAGQDPTDWRSLPTIDKYLMMEHFETFTTSGITRAAAMEVALQAERTRDFSPLIDTITVGLSSGTSGHRGLF